MKIRCFALLVAILFAFASILFSACSDDFKAEQNIRLLTKNIWVSDYYVDYSVNREFELNVVKYIFSDDGSLQMLKYNDTISGSWAISGCDYLILNGQTFKIAELSSKIMVLRYGTVNLVCLPEKD